MSNSVSGDPFGPSRPSLARCCKEGTLGSSRDNHALSDLPNGDLLEECVPEERGGPAETNARLNARSVRICGSSLSDHYADRPISFRTELLRSKLRANSHIAW